MKQARETRRAINRAAQEQEKEMEIVLEAFLREERKKVEIEIIYYFSRHLPRCR